MVTYEPIHTQTGGRAKPAQIHRAELWWWRYMRWSGLLLIPLVLGHLLIVHLINSVAVIDYHWVVTARWSYLGWRIYDAFMLWFAGLHGYRGFVYVVNDYVHGRLINQALRVGMLIIMLTILTLGSIALIGTPFLLPER